MDAVVREYFERRSNGFRPCYAWWVACKKHGSSLPFPESMIPLAPQPTRQECSTFEDGFYTEDGTGARSGPLGGDYLSSLGR